MLDIKKPQPTHSLALADVDRKMRLYAVITALKNGFFPSNDQISDSLKYAVTHAPFDTNALSKDGQQLVKDARNVIETVSSANPRCIR